jgi:hypothetical protein
MRAKRVDSNQTQIVAALRQIPGVSVAVTSSLGEGYPDLNIGWKGMNYLIELKDGSKPPSERKLTGEEEKFKDKWKGQYAVCKNLEEILLIIGIKIKS